MKRSNRLLILLGLLIAISGALAAVAYVASSPGGGGGGNPEAAASPTGTPEPTVPVVWATKAIPVGTTITSDMVATELLTLSARTALGEGTYASVSEVVGKMAGSDIAVHQVIVAGTDILAPGSALDGKSIADSITPGFVAVSMELDQTNGVGTLIVPGDHVDIILTVYISQLAISVKDTNGTPISLGGNVLTSKLVLENARVLRVLLPPATEAQAPAPAANGSAAPVAAAPTNSLVQFTDRHMIAIVEVHQEDAELIRWAQRAESPSPQTYIDLAFALRSASNSSSDPTTLSAKVPASKVQGLSFKEIMSEYSVIPPDPTGTLPKALADQISW